MLTNDLRPIGYINCFGGQWSSTVRPDENIAGSAPWWRGPAGASELVRRVRTLRDLGCAAVLVDRPMGGALGLDEEGKPRSAMAYATGAGWHTMPGDKRAALDELATFVWEDDFTVLAFLGARARDPFTRMTVATREEYPEGLIDFDIGTGSGRDMIRMVFGGLMSAGFRGAILDSGMNPRNREALVRTSARMRPLFTVGGEAWPTREIGRDTFEPAWEFLFAAPWLAYTVFIADRYDLVEIPEGAGPNAWCMIAGTKDQPLPTDRAERDALVRRRVGANGCRIVSGDPRDIAVALDAARAEGRLKE